MSAQDGSCDAFGYNDRDMEALLAGRIPQPWYCEKEHGHEGEHGMPLLRALRGDAVVDAQGPIMWMDPTEVAA